MVVDAKPEPGSAPLWTVDYGATLWLKECGDTRRIGFVHDPFFRDEGGHERSGCHVKGRIAHADPARGPLVLPKSRDFRGGTFLDRDIGPARHRTIDR